MRIWRQFAKQDSLDDARLSALIMSKFIHDPVAINFLRHRRAQTHIKSKDMDVVFDRVQEVINVLPSEQRIFDSLNKLTGKDCLNLVRQLTLML